jgi:PPM family protein phosphatase
MSRFLTRVFSEKGKREANEDSCTAQRIGDETYFLAVADGMGGKKGGEIASKLVISNISEYLKKTFKKNISDNDLKGIISEAFLIAQNAISSFNFNNPSLKGMGTTLSLLLVHNKSYAWGNIGDSRIYLAGNTDIKLITEDHTFISDYLKSGRKELPANVLASYSNIVTKIIDGGKDEPDIYPSIKKCNLLEEGNIFLLCSDGLIIDKSIDLSHIFYNIISKNGSLRRISRNLVKWALENGSDDNISVVIGKYGISSNRKDDEDEEDYKTVRIVLKSTDNNSQLTELTGSK